MAVAGDSAQKKTVAVIGAGMTGLCSLRHFALDPNYSVTAYEQMNTIAGIWNYPEGCEECCGEQGSSPRYCRMYRNLRAITPRYLTRFMDFAYPEDVTDSYCRRSVVRDYFDGYADHFGLRQFIRFRHKVLLITPIQARNSGAVRWSVTARNLETDTESTEEFDSVIICTGHFHTLYQPLIPGLDQFEGTVMHSCEYRIPDAFIGQNVLIIGEKTSAADIATEIIPYAKQVIIHRRFKASVFEAKFPNVVEIANLDRFDGHNLIQKNGTIRPVDTVILCTGYIYDYPFLSPECHVTVTRGRITPLWRHMIHCQYPSLCFVGLAQMAVFFHIADTQVRFYKAITDGKVVLPGEKVMLEETEAEFQERVERGLPEHLAHEMIVTQWDYVAQLAGEAGLTDFEPVARKMFEANIVAMRQAPYDYRNYRMEPVDGENFIRERLLVNQNGH